MTPPSRRSYVADNSEDITPENLRGARNVYYGVWAVLSSFIEVGDGFLNMPYLSINHFCAFFVDQRLILSMNSSINNLGGMPL